MRKAPKQDDRLFAQELRNLSILSHLKHPNLVELFCSYQYRGTYNFIFAEADGGTLAQVLRGDIEVPSLFVSGDSVLIALSGLASAIATMHNFSADILDLKLTGCHHDLAPRNIFIRENTFILGDFGLSTFKSTEENSLTVFKHVRSDYAAPECQRFQRDYIETGNVTRASDMWSLGCILAEVATFMIRGSAGVKQFRKERRYDVSSEITWYRFHQGPAGASSQVYTWLSSLRQNTTSAVLSLITCSEELLVLEPAQRPNAAEVLRRLRCATIQELCEEVAECWEILGNLSGVANLRLERRNFESWSYAFDILYKNCYARQQQDIIETMAFDFQLCVDTLHDTCKVLHHLKDDNNDNRRRTAKKLQWNNIQLLSAVPSHYRALSKTHVEQSILQDLSINISDFDGTSANRIFSEDVGILVAVKLLTQREEMGLTDKRSDLYLKNADVKLHENLEQHTWGLVEQNGQHVLVEWVQYTFAWVDDVVGRQFRDRVALVAALLHNDDDARISGTLRSRGYFHSPSRRGFGLVYELPGRPLHEIHGLTLNQMLHAGMSHRPTLEGRVRLGLAVSQAIYHFHSVGWLHRNLNPTNIVFFPEKDASESEWARTPFVLGFGSSRQNEKDAVTLGPAESLNYHSPEYLQHKDRFHERYDYYSLGMLLLEIGHWAPLSKITAGARFQGLRPELFKKEILTSRLSQLGLTLGTRYLRVVQRCLIGDFNAGQEEGHIGRESALREVFKRDIVDVLSVLAGALA
jgi:serine/threonine protein kinase